MAAQTLDWLEEPPLFELPGREQAEVFANAIAKAGELATKSYVDVHINAKFGGGLISPNDDLQRIIVHGSGKEYQDSVILSADSYHGNTQFQSTRTTYLPTDSGPSLRQDVTHKWLQSDPRDGLQLVTAKEVEGNGQEVVARERTNLAAIQDTLQTIGLTAHRLPEPDRQFAPYNTHWASDSFTADAQLFVPVVAKIAKGIAGVVGRELPEGHHINAEMLIDIGSSGRVYNKEHGPFRQGDITLSVIDARRRTGMDFRLTFDHLTVARGIEYVLARGYLRTEERSDHSIVYTREILGQRQDNMTVTTKRQVHGQAAENPGAKVVQNTIITDLAQRAIDFAAEGLATKN